MADAALDAHSVPHGRAERRPAPPPRPRHQPDRARDRGHRPARRGRRAVHDRGRPQPPAGARRGGRLPRRPHAADAARRDARHRPGHARRAPPASRSACRSATAARPRARRPRPADRRRPASCAPSELRTVAGAPAVADATARGSTSGSTLGVRALDTLVPVRPRPAPRHLRRLGRRQVDAARHDRPRRRRATST